MSRNFFWNRSGSPWGPFAVVFASDTLIVSSDGYGTNPYAWQDVSGTPSWGYVAGAETCAIERDALGWKITLSGPLAATLRGPTDPTNPCGSYAGDGIAATVALPEGTLTPVDYTYAQPWNDDTGTPFADAPFYPGDTGSDAADTVASDTTAGGLAPFGGPASPMTLAGYTCVEASGGRRFGANHETDNITIGSGGSLLVSGSAAWGGDASALALCQLLAGALQTDAGKCGTYTLVSSAGAQSGSFNGYVAIAANDASFAPGASFVGTSGAGVLLLNSAASVTSVPAGVPISFAGSSDYANYGLAGPGMPEPSVVAPGTVYDGGLLTGDADLVLLSQQQIADALLRAPSGTAAAGSAMAVLADRTGYKLAADGLDAVSVTPPTGPATTFREMLVQLWRRFFGKAVLDRDAGTLTTYADDGGTVVTTQTALATGSVETQGAAALPS